MNVDRLDKLIGRERGLSLRGHVQTIFGKISVIMTLRGG